MKLDRLMRFVPAGAVLAVAVFLGLAHEKVNDFRSLFLIVGFGATIALMALASFDYGAKRRVQSGR
jgi:hypothetical protein